MQLMHEHNSFMNTHHLFVQLHELGQGAR